MKNIVLLGASNCLMMGGFKEAFVRDERLSNLSTAGMRTLVKIYELKRPRNAKAIAEADLIVLESNIIDYHDEGGRAPPRLAGRGAFRPAKKSPRPSSPCQMAQNHAGSTTSTAEFAAITALIALTF